MNFTQAIGSCFSKYATFSGRAARSEFWYWALFVLLLSIATNIIDFTAFPDNELTPVSSILGLALLLPNIAVAIRRLHDIDRTGWWFLIAFTGIGIFLLLYWDCVKGTDGPNTYGPDPLAGQ